MQINLSDETIESLILDTLAIEYWFCIDGIEALKEIKFDFGVLESYQKEDLKAYKKLKKALKLIINHYATQDKAKEILK